MPHETECRIVQIEKENQPQLPFPYIPDNTYLLNKIYEKLIDIHTLQKAYLGEDVPPIKPYKVFSLDLGTARDNAKELSLNGKINQLTVLTLGGGSLSIRLNGSNNDLIPLYVSSPRLEGIPITSIYWKNTAQSGLTAVILAAWVD